MGHDKSQILLNGKTLLDLAILRLSSQVDVLCVNSNAKNVSSHVPIIPDTIARFSGSLAGPLAGVLAGLEWAHTLVPAQTHIVTVPVDAPYFPANLVARLRGGSDDKICVASSSGRIHPVFALWPLTITQSLRQWLEEPDNRSAGKFISSGPHIIVDFPRDEALDPFTNINTQADFELAKALHQTP